MTAAAPRNHPLVELTRTRVLEFVREPEALFWVFVFPVLMAVALGIAFRSKPPEAARVAVVGEPAAVAWAVGALEAAGGLEARPLPETEAREALRTGDVDLVVDLTRGDRAGAFGGDLTRGDRAGAFGGDLRRGDRAGASGGDLRRGDRAGASGADARDEPGVVPRFTYLFDPTHPGARAARLAADAALQRALGRADPAAVEDREFREPGGRYIDFVLPGLIGLNLMGSAMWGIGFSVVGARTKKMLKRFAATAMRRSDYLLSLGLSRLVLLVLEMVALVGFGRLAFGVVVRGSYGALVAVTLAGTAAFAGIALLVSARPRSIEAASGWMNFVMVPMWVLSGSFFAYSRFPDLVQPAIRLLPLTALNDALRAVINDGAPLAATWPELLVLAGWAALSFALALRLFRWQ